MTTTLPHHVTELVDGVRTAVTAHAGWADTAAFVAEQLRVHTCPSRTC